MTTTMANHRTLEIMNDRIAHKYVVTMMLPTALMRRCTACWKSKGGKFLIGTTATYIGCAGYASPVTLKVNKSFELGLFFCVPPTSPASESWTHKSRGARARWSPCCPPRPRRTPRRGLPSSPRECDLQGVALSMALSHFHLARGQACPDPSEFRIFGGVQTGNRNVSGMC